VDVLRLGDMYHTCKHGLHPQVLCLGGKVKYMYSTCNEGGQALGKIVRSQVKSLLALIQGFVFQIRSVRLAEIKCIAF